MDKVDKVLIGLWLIAAAVVGTFLVQNWNDLPTVLAVILRS